MAALFKCFSCSYIQRRSSQRRIDEIYSFASCRLTLISSSFFFKVYVCVLLKTQMTWRRRRGKKIAAQKETGAENHPSNTGLANSNMCSGLLSFFFFLRVRRRIHLAAAREGVGRKAQVSGCKEKKKEEEKRRGGHAPPWKFAESFA